MDDIVKLILQSSHCVFEVVWFDLKYWNVSTASGAVLTGASSVQEQNFKKINFLKKLSHEFIIYLIFAAWNIQL